MLGFAVWPPLTIWSTPNYSNTLARPSPATTATIAGPGRSGVSADWPFVEVSTVVGSGSGAVAAPASVAGELRRPRLADVARLVVEVLDADPAEAAHAEAVADHLVRPLVVDVDLERPGVAGDEDGLADRLEVVADRVDVERPARVRLEQVHRLVAESLVGVGDQRRRLRRPHVLGRRPPRPGPDPSRWSSAPWNSR